MTSSFLKNKRRVDRHSGKKAKRAARHAIDRKLRTAKSGDGSCLIDAKQRRTLIDSVFAQSRPPADRELAQTVAEEGVDPRIVRTHRGRRRRCSVSAEIRHPPVVNRPPFKPGELSAACKKKRCASCFKKDCPCRCHPQVGGAA